MRTAFARVARRAATSAAVILALMIWPFARALVDLRAAPEAPPEIRAIGVIRAVQKAQAMYSAAFGYYDRLECLIQASCVPNPYPPSYLSPNAFRSTAFGYRFRLHEGGRAVVRGNDALSAGAMQAFAMVAVPLEEQRAGQRAFCGDDSGEVYVTNGNRPPEIIAGPGADTTNPLR
jgi:hypothetical protein